MLEQTRLDYLRAMGVAQWMPRHALPFAPEPRWLATAANQNTQAQVEAQDTDAHAIPDIEDLLNEQSQTTAQAPVHNPAAKPATVTSQPVQANEPVRAAVIAPALDPARNITPNFQLFFVSSSLPVVWVCDNVEEVEMLQRFIHSVQKGMFGRSDFVAQAFEFRWPFLQTNQQDQSLPVALQALKAHWLFMQQSNNAKGVIAVGPQSQQWLQQIEVKQIQQAPTVTELMHNAALKRQLWQSLLPLL